jgi:hypothetical protein
MVRIETNESRRKRSEGGGPSLTRRRLGLSGQTTKRVFFIEKTGIGLNSKNRLVEHNAARLKPVFKALRPLAQKRAMEIG